jgi:copper chaperone
MERLTMSITGMSCGHCVGAVTKALQTLDGVRVESVSIGAATVEYDASATSPAAIAEAVEDAGYFAEPSGSAA